MEIGTLRKYLCTFSVGVALLLGLSIPAEAQRRWRDDDNWRSRNYGQWVSAQRHRRNRLRQSLRRRQRLQQRQWYTARLNRRSQYYRLARERRFRQRQLTAARIRRVREQRFRQRQLRAARIRHQRELRFHRRQARAAHTLQRRATLRQRWYRMDRRY
ncbi:MAG TPA: hypothetical protein VD861_04735 [Pyrinomonadaceae bacterium]|nr:hypothetical protein [Pyrinomonadaceae bacterium]